MNRRRLLLSLVGFGAVAAVEAKAGLRFHGSAYVPPVVTGPNIRSTQSQYVDFFPELNSVAADVMVLVTLTGVGLFTPWPAPPTSGFYVVAGTPRAFTVRELNNQAKFSTSGATDGQTASIVATWAGGTATRNFVVKNFPTAITKQIGPRTYVGYGGLQIASELPGTASNWSIKSQKQGVTNVTMFAIWPNNTALTWCDNAGGTSSAKYGTANLNGTAVLGVGAYTVVLQNPTDGLPDVTVTFDCLTQTRSVAPNPGVDYTGSHLNQLGDTWLAACCFGDVILAEDGNYNPGGATTNLVTGTGYTLRTVNAATSVQPLNTTNGPWGTGNWTWDGRTFDPGWISIRAVHPHSAQMGKITFDMRGVNQTNVGAGYFGTKLDWMDMTVDTFVVQNPGAGQNNFSQWFATNSTTRVSLALSSTDFTANFFFLKDYQTATLEYYGQEGQVIGNFAYGCLADVWAFFTYNTSDNGRSQFRWNIVLNQNSQNYSTVHPDVVQPHTTTNLPRLNAIDATTWPMDFIGGRWCKGVTGTQSGFDLPTFQGINIGAVYQSGNANSLGVWRIFGLALCSEFSIGISVSNCGPGSYVRNCDLVQPGYQTNYDPAAPGFGGLVGCSVDILEYTVTTAGLTSALTLDYCSISNGGLGSGYYFQTGGGFRTPPTPTTAFNAVSPSLAASYNTTQISAGPGSTWQTRQAIEDAFVQKPLGPLTVAGYAGGGTPLRNIGSGDATKINQRAWIWDTSLTPGCS